MKCIVIVRHAKSVGYGYDDDFNRKLTNRGKDDARLLSSMLKEERVKPDIIISSPAKRAFKTAKIYAETLRYPMDEIRTEDDLYSGMTTQEFVEMVGQLPDTAHTVFVFGHNPSAYYFVNNLLKQFNADMPTCSTVAIDFETDRWTDITVRCGKLAFHLTPRMYD